jgi:hypothetical protein
VFREYAEVFVEPRCKLRPAKSGHAGGFGAGTVWACGINYAVGQSTSCRHINAAVHDDDGRVH